MMQEVLKTSIPMPIFERGLAAIVLFYGAFAFCLPVAFDDFFVYPWWATRIDFWNIVLHEAAFMVWLIIFGPRFVPRLLSKVDLATRQAAIFLFVLAIWCGLVSLILSPLPLQDLGRSFRLLLMVIMIFAVIQWTRITGVFTLLMLIVGFFLGTLVNLAMSFANPFIVNETMRLSGQNTPGVGMGVAIHLAAWLFFSSKTPMLQTCAVIVALVCGYGCGISFSRVGWIVGAMGLVAWCYVIVVAKSIDHVQRRRMSRIRVVWAPLILLGIAMTIPLSTVQEYLEWVQNLLEQKDWLQSQSNDYRLAYFIGVAEIIVTNPLGVGYSGFYEAMVATEVYDIGRAALEQGFEANPHSGFLYYTSAGGLIGGILCVAVFVFLLRSMRLGLVSWLGQPGPVLFYLMAAAYIMVGLAVPYIFNSIIMIVPVAIAAGWGVSRRVQYDAPTAMAPISRG